MKLSMMKPLSAMLASLLMSLIFVASNSLKADSRENQITIKKGDVIEKTLFTVNGNRFDWKDLTSAQQLELESYFTEIDDLEAQLNQTTDVISLKSSLIEAKVALLEQQIALAMESEHHDIRDITRDFEDEIAEIEFSMPEVDQALVQSIEAKARNIELLLVDVSTGIVR